MIPLAVGRMAEIAALCRRYGVRRLDLFGSAATGEFDSETSDLDFLVEFPEGRSLGPWVSDLTCLQRDLTALFGRTVDIVMATALRDPYFKREATKNRVPLFDASEIAKVAE